MAKVKGKVWKLTPTEENSTFRSKDFKELEGRFSRIRNKRDLTRKFPERRSEIRKAVSASGYELQGAGFDRYCISVLNLVAR